MPQEKFVNYIIFFPQIFTGNTNLTYIKERWKANSLVYNYWITLNDIQLPVVFHVQMSWEANQDHENQMQMVHNDKDKTTSRMDIPEEKKVMVIL